MRVGDATNGVVSLAGKQVDVLDIREDGKKPEPDDRKPKQKSCEKVCAERWESGLAVWPARMRQPEYDDCIEACHEKRREEDPCDRDPFMCNRFGLPKRYYDKHSYNLELPTDDNPRDLLVRDNGRWYLAQNETGNDTGGCGLHITEGTVGGSIGVNIGVAHVEVHGDVKLESKEEQEEPEKPEPPSTKCDGPCNQTQSIP